MLDSSILNDKEYMRLIDKYINNNEVMRLKDIPHHDSNRLNHSLKVSYYSYKICKKLNLNYISAAKAGILHDLFFTRSANYNKAKDKPKLIRNFSCVAGQIWYTYGSEVSICRFIIR